MENINRKNDVVYPYIPNSAPHNSKKMMKYLNIKDLDELYSEIPEELIFKEKLDIPDAILDEYSIKKHTEKILSKNTSCTDYTSFLGAGCAQHYVPAVVDEITTRGEFLTCYGSESWSDHGKYQAFFEYNSMMVELLETEVITAPQYDGGQALATAISMSNRINGKTKVLIPRLLNPEMMAIILNYIDSVQTEARIRPVFIEHLAETGTLDINDLKAKLDRDTTAIILENRNYLGMIEPETVAIGDLAKKHGAEFIVYVDPISLGILEAPPRYGGTIVCGDLHSLGLHLSFGGGQAGFISTDGSKKYLYQYKDFFYSMAEPEVEGEYVFGNMLFDRTHYARRAKGNEFTGTGTNLWMISAAVYLALMGPQGMKEVGQTILYNSNYAAKKIAEIPSVKLRYKGPLFQEFVVDFNDCGLTVNKINKKLLEHKIFGGLDLSGYFKNMGQCALFSVTEIHSQEDIDNLVEALTEIVSK